MKSSKNISSLICLAISSTLLLSTYSCSTILNGSYQKVSVRANEEGAEIFVDGNNAGRTPAIIKMKRGDEHIIEIKKAGFDTYRVTTGKTIAGMFWLNFCFFAGIIIDLATGNAYNVEPKIINAQLTKSTSMLENYNSDDYSYVYLKDKSGKIVDSFVIEWE